MIKDLREMIVTEIHRIMSKGIRVDGERNYKNTHGKHPGGRGNWWFQIGDNTETFNGLYGDAKKQAMASKKKMSEIRKLKYGAKI